MTWICSSKGALLDGMPCGPLGRHTEGVSVLTSAASCILSVAQQIWASILIKGSKIRAALRKRARNFTFACRFIVAAIVSPSVQAAFLGIRRCSHPS
jgi:hypothetical protein